MQWVVTTGRTVDEARERALDALGIDEDDLDYEVLDEPRSSLLGLRTSEARVRARVRPTRPRPKVDRRSRRSRRDGKRRRPKRGGRRGRDDASSADSGSDDAAQPAADEQHADTEPRAEAGATAKTPAPTSAATGLPPAAERAAAPRSDPPTTPDRGARGATMSDIPLTEQEPTAVDFVRGLVDAFGAEAEVHVEHLDDDDAIEVHVEGDDLGLLVGPRGSTLAAIAELTRTAVAQQHSGRLEGRLRVDVAGYRARRKEALIRFAGQVADKVRSTGSSVALEPMSPPDRKIVHDAVGELDGVHTSSRGEDRRRHVVIHPDD